jgi:amino-acid N-acetyltransferase
VVAVAGGQIVGCAELAPLSHDVAEVRSLVVSRDARRLGAGVRMVEELALRARREGHTRLCAFAHDPAFFVRRGFSIVPHTWVPEKIAHDCNGCALFRNCGQYAILLEVDRASAERTSNLRRAAGARPSPAHV